MKFNGPDKSVFKTTEMFPKEFKFNKDYYTYNWIQKSLSFDKRNKLVYLCNSSK